MTKKLFKRIWLLLWRLCLLLPIFFVKADENLSVIDKVTDEEANHINQRIKFISATPWKVRINIHNAHEDLSFSERWAGWILEIDDIMNYMVQIIQFLSQLGLVVWTIFIMYAGYKYIISVLNSQKTPSSTIKNAIIWILIIIFSYAIMRILTSFIWLT
jgi:hypothetical protein